MRKLATTPWVVLSLLFAAGSLFAIKPSHAEIVWPASEQVIGETSDLIQHLIAVAPAVAIEDDSIAQPQLVAHFYQARAFQPAWLDADGVSLDASDLLVVLRRAGLEGLPEGRYHLAAVEARLARPMEDALHLAQLDLLLTDAFLHYSKEVRSGRGEPGKADPKWLIRPARTDFPALLREALAQHKVEQILAGMPPADEAYRKLRLSLARYRALERRGGWPTLPTGRKLLKKGVRDPRIASLRWRLISCGDLGDKPPRDENLFDEAVDKALRRFQRRHGLEMTGQVDAPTLAALNVPVAGRIRQIELSMERLRWMPRERPHRYVLVNMAGYELSVVDEGRPILEMPVIVGTEQRQTPALDSTINKVVLNPYWYVPTTVLYQDLLPRLIADSAYLSQVNMRVFSSLEGQGSEVDPRQIQWKNYKKGDFPYTLRQDPGPTNALGRIKFLFANNEGIYLHDTPNRGLFRQADRAFSSGCIRVEDPLTLAEVLLDDQQNWSASSVQKAIKVGKPQHVELANPVPIYLVYWTAWVNELNELHFREDVYGRDRRLDSALTSK